jgi:hypothetical protein
MSDPTDLADALRDALGPSTSLVHPTYRHLARPVTLAGLNRTQWALAILALAATWAFTALVPLSAQWALSIGGTLVGVPASVLFVLSANGEFSLRAIARGVLSWRRQRRVLLPEPGMTPRGYELLAAPSAPRADSVSPGAQVALHDLWASLADPR